MVHLGIPSNASFVCALVSWRKMLYRTLSKYIGSLQETGFQLCWKVDIFFSFGSRKKWYTSFFVRLWLKYSFLTQAAWIKILGCFHGSFEMLYFINYSWFCKWKRIFLNSFFSSLLANLFALLDLFHSFILWLIFSNKLFKKLIKISLLYDSILQQLNGKFSFLPLDNFLTEAKVFPHVTIHVLRFQYCVKYDKFN